MSPLLTSAWLGRLGRALLHSCWQATIVALILALVLHLLRRGPAERRYLAACLALVAMVLWPIASAFLLEGRPVGDGGPGDGWEAASGASEYQPGRGGPISWASSPRSSLLAAAAVWLGPLPGFLARAWLVGVAVLGLRLVGGWLRIQGLEGRSARPVAGPWRAVVDRLGQELGVGCAVELRESARVRVPMVVGALRPVIYLPASALTGLPSDQLAAILAHELAHVGRHDYLVNLVQSVLELLLFYHPAARWASRVIRAEREHCCDDAAVRACGDRLIYARALAALEASRGPDWTLSPAATGGTLLARIRRILGKEESTMSVRMVLGQTLVVSIGSAIAVAAWAASPIPPREQAIDPAASPGPESVVIARVVDPTQTTQPLPGAPGPEVPAGPGIQATQKPIGLSRMPLGEGDGPTERRAEALSAPSEEEVWARIPGPRNPATKRKNPRFLIEKLAERADPCKDYPLAGHAQLVHNHYKATVYFDEVLSSDYPVPFEHVEHKVEVVYIDKDDLRRCKHAEERPATAPADLRQMDQKLEQMIRELEGMRREIQARLNTKR